MSNVEEFSGPSYKERLDISQVFLRQLDRTNFSASGDDNAYPGYVRQTMRLLPLQWQEWVQDQEDRYSITESVLQFKTFSGVRMGSQNKPALRDRTKEVLRLDDDSVDWSDPNILSPTLQEKTTIDYEKMNQVVSEAAEFAGISWQTETIAGDRGDAYPVIRKQTPYYGEKLTKSEETKNQKEVIDEDGEY